MLPCALCSCPARGWRSWRVAGWPEMGRGGQRKPRQEQRQHQCVAAWCNGDTQENPHECHVRFRRPHFECPFFKTPRFGGASGAARGVEPEGSASSSTCSLPLPNYALEKLQQVDPLLHFRFASPSTPLISVREPGTLLPCNSRSRMANGLPQHYLLRGESA